MKAKTQFDSISQLSFWLVFVMLALSALLIPAGPVPADFAGLTQLFDSLLADGAIAAELKTSLLAKVENANTSYEAGDVCTAVNQLNALKNQIAAQSGKKISDAAAARLRAYIDDLATQLLGTLPAGGGC